MRYPTTAALRQSLNLKTWFMIGALGTSAIVAASAIKADSHSKIIESHGYSFFGELAYGADFPHLNYVNPDAPKGGEMAISTQGTFDSFNPYARKGRSAAFVSDMYETLMAGAQDDYGAMYCFLCTTIEYPEDKEWVIFNLRRDVTFSDGTPMTAEDVVFSHNIFLEQGLPSYATAVSKRILSAEALDNYTVKFTFAPDIPRRGLIGQVAGNIVFSKAWFDENDARLDESRLDAAVGTGPYVIDSYKVNEQMVFKRNPNYWGANVPLQIGHDNFDKIRIEYFADSNAAFEAFKSGVFTYRQEVSSKIWSTGYDFPALEKGWVKKELLPAGRRQYTGGFSFNLGSEIFKDKRVRQAFALAYNFTWTNETLQYGLFSQRESFWQGTDHQATGKPTGLELEILMSVKDLIDPSILTDDVVVPHKSGERQLDRKNIRKASRLLDDAGWVIGDDGLRRKDGKVLEFEFLSNNPGNDRVVLPYIENLKALGIDAKYERIDPAQYTNRRRDRDYDMLRGTHVTPELPSTGLRQNFGSDSAETSVFNPSGFSHPAADKIIDDIVASTDKARVIAGTKALDRIMRHEMFMIPVWFNNEIWVAAYDIFGRPDPLVTYASSNLDIWWYDAEKAAKLKSEGALN